MNSLLSDPTPQPPHTHMQASSTRQGFFILFTDMTKVSRTVPGAEQIFVE